MIECLGKVLSIFKLSNWKPRSKKLRYPSTISDKAEGRKI
jgi:hypothetical protein